MGAKMNLDRVKRAASVVLWMAGATLLSAQSDMRGHWTGNLDTPGGALGVEVDLDKAADGWIGSFAIPARGATGVVLTAITLNEGKVSFVMKDVPGDPGFTGTLSADGMTLDGQFSQGGMSLPLKLARSGDAKVVVPKPSPPVGAEFLGTWEGLIEGQGLHLVLALSNGKAGVEAVMTSPDQGNVRVPVGAVSQAGAKLLILVPVVAGSYSGEISKDGTEINGTWTQGGMPFPLNLKKSTSAK
jgi:hypothetical protein